LCALHGWQSVQLSMAASTPTKRGRKSVLPPSGADPWRGPAWPKIAKSWATEKSQAIPTSWPPPMRIPLTRQMTGLSHVKMALTMSLKRRMYCRYSSGRPA
jgi:hypothetical protein